MWGVALVMAGCPRRWQSRGGCCHPFAAGVNGMMGFAVLLAGRGQSEARPRHEVGVLTWTTRADRFRAETDGHAAVLAGGLVCWLRW